MHVLAALGLAALSVPAAPTQEPDLGARLAAAVDLPLPEERRAAARALALDESVSLEAWLEACRAFPSIGEVTTGTRIEEAQLHAEGELETTPIAIHVPAGYRPGTPAPLLLALHWASGRGAPMVRVWSQLAEEHGLLVCAPDETGPNDGYGFSQRERDVALSALRWMRRQFDVDENRVYVTGISRGGHLAWDLALRHPDLFAGVAPMIGAPTFDIRGGRANLRYLENLLPTTLVDLQGAQDQEGLVWNLRYAFERLEELGATRTVYHEFSDLGHAYRMEEADWEAFFAARRDPRPEEVVRRYARPGEGRAFWIDVLEGTEKVQEEFVPMLSASRNARLDEPGRRRWLLGETDERTGRLWARFARPNRIEARVKGVAHFRLLLTGDMFEERGTFEVKVGSRRRKSEVRPRAATLLAEFVERFDRTFLPVAEVEVQGSSR